MLALTGGNTPKSTFRDLVSREYGPKAKQELINDAAASLVNRTLIRNIPENNCTKTIYNGLNQSILSFDVKDHFAAIHYWNKSLQLVDLDTNECLWTVDVKLPIYGKSMVKIVEDKVICVGVEKFNDQSTIRIVDLKSGEETTSFSTWTEDDDTACSKVCVLGKSIYTIEQNEIIEKDSHGKEIRASKLDNPLPAIIFLGQGKFLVHISKADIIIRDLEKAENGALKIGIDTLGEEVGSVTSATIDHDRLICSMIGENNTKPSCCVIELQSGTLLGRYSHADYAHALFILPMYSKINTILADRDLLYLGNDLGGVAAINLIEKRHHFFGWHKNSIQHLTLKDGILISASGSNRAHRAELKFWDVRTLKLLGSKKFDSLTGLLFQEGKVFAGIEQSFIRWDYLVSHRDEKLSEYSAPEIKIDPGARNCIIQ